MRALPFRTWYVLALLGTAVAFSQLARLLVPLQPASHYDTQALRAASVTITRGSAHRADPAWQRALSARLSALHVDAVVTSSSRRVLYRHDTGLLTNSPISTWTVVTTAGNPNTTCRTCSRHCTVGKPPATGRSAGLGLAIARRILQAHGGGLTAANRSGGGAVFTGTLPLQRAAPPPADPVQESLAHTP